MIIKPTVGRVVWFHKYNGVSGHQGPLAALVTKIHSDTCVNLVVFSETGVPFGETSVVLIHNEDTYTGNYCCWMPYQKGQAAKHEALEKQLAGK